MLTPPGFQKDAVVTPLGTLAYACPDPEFWFPQGSPPEQPLVFLHGFGGGSSSFEWSKVYPAFAADYRVLAPDLLGWGESDHPERNYRLDDYLTTIAAFLQATCDGPVPVVASSLTAAMVVRLAVEQPGLISQLFLVAPAGLSDFGEDFRNSSFAQIARLPIIDQLIYRGAIATAPGISGFLEQRQFADSDRISSDIVNAYLASAQKDNADYAALAFVRGDLCFDLAKYLPQLDLPTTLLWGEASQLTPLATGQKLAQLNPTEITRFITLPDVGLTPQLEQPATTIALIRQFLAPAPSQ
jgi:pimeloyl-ACP methyl ester carboxylesterase